MKTQRQQTTWTFESFQIQKVDGNNYFLVMQDNKLLTVYGTFRFAKRYVAKKTSKSYTNLELKVSVQDIK